MAAVVSFVLHLYVPPPTAVKVVLVPLQMVLVPEMLGVGNGFTVTAWLAVAEQFTALVTVTVYVIFAVGLTVMAAAVEPLLHA